MSIFFKIAITAAVIVLTIILWFKTAENSPSEDNTEIVRSLWALGVLAYVIGVVSFLIGIWLL